jgi:hypothetical protein
MVSAGYCSPAHHQAGGSSSVLSDILNLPRNNGIDAEVTLLPQPNQPIMEAGASKTACVLLPGYHDRSF